MRLPANIVLMTIGLTLLVIAIPYGLVQLDVLAARHLRIIPSVITAMLGVAFIVAAIVWMKARKEKR